MDTNTLVYHKLQPELGVGAVFNVGKKFARVKFGLFKTVKVEIESLKEIDTSKGKTIRIELLRKKAAAGKLIGKQYIVGNELREHVSDWGFLIDRLITEKDIRKFIRVIE